MAKIGIGVIGAGYMGKAHSVAMNAVGAVFNTPLKPVCEMLCATTESGAAAKAESFGFNRSTADWRVLIEDPAVEAVIIASPQSTHREIALAAIAKDKPVLCEKPMGASLDDARTMTLAAEAAGIVNMVGFNYVRTPATQYARKLIQDGAIGDPTWFRGEHTEDFLADVNAPANWRTRGRATGTMGDLSSHMINCAIALMGSVAKVNADIETVHKRRPAEQTVARPDKTGNSANEMEEVTNDDHAHCLCRFDSGVMGHLYFSRVSTGRKMGYAYEVNGTRGAIRFDQEDQNALWLYKMDGPEAERGFRKILTGPAHPDYVDFCLGPGHGTGYQDQLIIEAKDFLNAIHSGQSRWPTFRDGMEVTRVIEAMWQSHDSRQWVSVEREQASA
ncbi:oxidoreductase [Chromatiales bacterium (ex Bugula neritina AB1)]|nr:oxidoreductase [Chromatiales bacterium (ex Bugula neritina AB1)]